VDIVVKGRHTEVPERFRQHVSEKLAAKVEKLAPRVIRIDVEVSREHNPRQADVSDRVELTIRSRGPVVRAEAAADDPYAALDAACSKLEARLRRAADRRRVHHGGKTPVSVASATSALVSADGAAAAAGRDGDSPTEGDTAPSGVLADAAAGVGGDGPMVIREKVHDATPMTLDQALYEMELVGHDFFLFVDEPTGRPSVVYRRKGWDYGVIRLQLEGGEAREPA
jgi:ribosomal subunit interface protein